MSSDRSTQTPEILKPTNHNKDSEEPLSIFTEYDSSWDEEQRHYTNTNTYSDFESAARTHFKLKEAPTDTKWKKQKWGRLQRWQRGTKPNHDGYAMEGRQSQSERNDLLFKKRQAECLSDASELNCAEKEIVVRASTQLNYVSFGAHSDIWKGILGLMAVVVENRRPQYGAEYETASLHRQEAFRELMGFAGLEYNGLKSVKRQIRDQLEWISEIR